MKGKMKAFLHGGAFFALLCLIAKGVGALYRIPLTNIMGAEGIGLYQMVFPLYSVLLSVSAGGLPSAISKTVSSFAAVGDGENARRTLRVSALTLTLAGLCATLLLIFLRGKIASLQGNAAAATAYIGIAPAVTVVAVISCLRGYFQGKLDMLPSGVSQIIEQLTKTAVGLFLCYRFMKYGVEYAAFGALLGVTASEVVAAAYLAVRYAFDYAAYKKRTVIKIGKYATEHAADFTAARSTRVPYKSLLKNVYATALPITLGSLVLPISAVIDSILVINLLTLGGESVAGATALFGLLNGPVGSLVNMPAVVTASLAVMLLPKISRLVKNRDRAADTSEKFFRMSLLAAAPCALAFMLFSDEILGILYRKTMSPELLGTGGILLAISALSVLFMSLLQPATAVLQGFDKAHKPALNLIIGAAVKAVLTIVLIRVMGIYGAATSTVACFALTCFLDLFAVRKCIKIKPKYGVFFRSALPALAAQAVMGKLSYFALAPFTGAFVAVIVSLVLCFAAYAAVVLAFKGISKEDMGALAGDKKDGQDA